MEVVVDRFGLLHAGEGGVDFASDLGDLGFAAFEEGCDDACAGAVHGVDGDVYAGGFDGVDVD